jgi:hypothetical protein
MLKVDVWESQKISEVEAESHQGRPTPRVAVRPLQSRVSKFRLSSPPKLDLGGLFVGGHCRKLQWVEAKCTVLAKCTSFLALFAIIFKATIDFSV